MRGGVDRVDILRRIGILSLSAAVARREQGHALVRHDRSPLTESCGRLLEYDPMEVESPSARTRVVNVVLERIGTNRSWAGLEGLYAESGHAAGQWSVRLPRRLRLAGISRSEAERWKGTEIRE